VDRRERAGLVGSAGATQHGRQARNLEQVGSLGRGKPSSASKNGEGQRGE